MDMDSAFEAWWEATGRSDERTRLALHQAFGAGAEWLQRHPKNADPDFVVVPRHPTKKMLYAGAEGSPVFYDHAKFVWEEMIAVAPKWPDA